MRILACLVYAYGANILLSEVSYAALNAALQAQCRYLGLVQVKGKQEPMGLYECLAGDSPELAARKRALQEPFGSSLQRFLNGDMAGAQAGFRALAAEIPDDQAAQRFLHQAAHYLQAGLPAGWVGVEVMEGK
jgi:two-component system sensor histidine kinase ChiS